MITIGRVGMPNALASAKPKDENSSVPKRAILPSNSFSYPLSLLMKPFQFATLKTNQMQRWACLLASLLGLLMGSAFNLLRLGLFICFEVLIFLIYRNFLKNCTYWQDMFNFWMLMLPMLPPSSPSCLVNE